MTPHDEAEELDAQALERCIVLGKQAGMNKLALDCTVALAEDFPSRAILALVGPRPADAMLAERERKP